MQASDLQQPQPARLVWRELEVQAPSITAAGLVLFAPSALNKVNIHVRSAPELEQIGLLLGSRETEQNGKVTIAVHDAIALEAESTPVHVASHKHAWPSAWKQLDLSSKTRSIVGWYHSHPGHGIFLSATDLATHQRWFGATAGVALVVDPVSRTLGCFIGGREIAFREQAAGQDQAGRASADASAT